MSRQAVGRAWAAALVALAFQVAGPALGADAPLAGISVVGTAFHVTDADGKVLRQDELVGAVLTAEDTEGHELTVRIDGWELDARDPMQEVVLYRLSTPDETGGWKDLCSPDPDGRKLGFPLGGRWTDSGEHVRAPTFGITCTSGAIGKCVRFGYKPWANGPDGKSLWELHQACVRMVRADYCGNGHGWTRNGMLIDIFDRLGIQKDETAPGLRFEAAWGPQGAYCVHHTRVPENGGLDDVLRMCPEKLSGRTGDSCTEDSDPEAALRNRS